MTSLEDLFGAAIVVPDVIGSAAAGALRARWDGAGFARFALLDRGSYDVLVDPREPELFARLTRLGEDHTGRRLEVAEARVLRLGAGDYLLAHHDPPRDDRRVELVLDVSPASVPGAEVHFRRSGQVYLRMPCAPGALAIVERGPTVTVNHTYVSRRHPGARVVRLVVALRVRAAP